MAHSTIVGGSTAKRVMACPGSVKLVQQVPPKPPSKDALRGTLLHDVIAKILEHDEPPANFLGATYEGEELTPELMEAKILPALAMLDAVDPDKQMEFAIEAVVGFGDFLPGVFGSADVLGRIGKRAVVWDWKFGDGVPVSPEENQQLMFYAAAAMRTPATKWVFDGADEIELVIAQPPSDPKRWVTTPDRIRRFEADLALAVHTALRPDAALAVGDHCRWCAAKPICPQMTGAVDRALQKSIKELDATQLGVMLQRADILEGWISDLRALALQVLESGNPVPGFKLVQKRGTRKWVDEKAAEIALVGLGIDPLVTELVSPAQAEKKLKAAKKVLPEGLTVMASSGTTLAPESDSRPAVMQIGQQLTAALSKLV
jgi:hypothetical protein